MFLIVPNMIFLNHVFIYLFIISRLDLLFYFFFIVIVIIIIIIIIMSKTSESTPTWAAICPI